MIQCECIHHDFEYDIHHLVKIFNTDEGNYLLTTELGATISVTLKKDDHVIASLTEESADVNSVKNQMKRLTYKVMDEHFECLSPWGILVGIRPVKIVHELLDKGVSMDDVPGKIRDEYLVSDEKIELLMEIAKRERPFLYPIEDDAISIYVCIPFCPTRCVYCSFPSNDIVKKQKIVDSYVHALIKEIYAMGQVLSDEGKHVDCIYIGGGTPTSLSAVQLDKVLCSVKKAMPIKNLKEWTIEAGRPDSIDREKLEVITSYPIDRICLNPQSMNEDTLKVIGRDHSIDDIYKVHSLMRYSDIHSINMDTILGLPGETLGHVKKTIESVIALEPENITVHTLAVKRASRLNENISDYSLDDGDDVLSMLEYTNGQLRQAGYVPYYMYRQKNMIGNLENVGYCKPGYESLYNMRIMEERHTILALGAGAQSKMCFHRENRFERVSNSKGVEDYIARVDEMIAKKVPYFQHVDEK